MDDYHPGGILWGGDVQGGVCYTLPPAARWDCLSSGAYVVYQRRILGGE